jgi:hypothetical protein
MKEKKPPAKDDLSHLPRDIQGRIRAGRNAPPYEETRASVDALMGTYRERDGQPQNPFQLFVPEGDKFSRILRTNFNDISFGRLQTFLGTIDVTFEATYPNKPPGYKNHPRLSEASQGKGVTFTVVSPDHRSEQQNCKITIDLETFEELALKHHHDISRQLPDDRQKTFLARLKKAQRDEPSANGKHR